MIIRNEGKYNNPVKWITKRHLQWIGIHCRCLWLVKRGAFNELFAAAFEERKGGEE